MNKKNVMLLVLAIIVAAACIGCANSPDFSVQEETVQMEKELTRRQISILEEMGLPIDYDKLNIGQQSAIHAIEDLLVQLETKYHEDFVYLAYSIGEGSGREHLTAYPASGTPEDAVTIYRWVYDNQIQYEDNRHLVEAKPIFEKAFTDYFSESVDFSHCQIYTYIYDAQQDITLETVAQKVYAEVYLFVDGDFISVEQFEEIGNVCEKWITEKCTSMPADILLMRTMPEKFYSVNSENFDNYIWKEIFTHKKNYRAEADGSLQITG